MRRRTSRITLPDIDVDTPRARFGRGLEISRLLSYVLTRSGTGRRCDTGLAQWLLSVRHLPGSAPTTNQVGRHTFPLRSQVPDPLRISMEFFSFNC